MMRFSRFVKDHLWQILSPLIFLSFWQVGAMLLGHSLLLPKPLEVFQYLWQLLGSADFYRTLAGTLVRGVGGFILAFFWGMTLGILSAYSKPVHQLLKPFLILFRSVPLLALILLAVIWFKQRQVPYFVVFLIVFPLITSNVTEGIKSEDQGLQEMSRAFQFSAKDRLLHITIPHLTPFLLAGISTGLGIAWKAVIAAEILTMPAYAVGTAMQRAQLELNSAALFAWTFTIILLSGFCDFLISLAGKGLTRD